MRRFGWIKAFLFMGVSAVAAIYFIEQSGPLDSKTPAGQRTFEQAKKEAKKIFADHRRTFYCNCSYNERGIVDLTSCGYRSPAGVHAHQIQWEHLMPARHFGEKRPCWRLALCRKKNGERYKGRACCRATDPLFRKMEADLHNLVPEIGELNRIRRDYAFGTLPHQPMGFGSCHFKLSRALKTVEPSEPIRGAIARAHLYMAATYHLELPLPQRRLFEQWHFDYPPTAWEIERNHRIHKTQGNENGYLMPVKTTSQK